MCNFYFQYVQSVLTYLVIIEDRIVSPMPGKGNAMEVLVQGKQIKAVTEFLIAQGVPKMWIESVDLSEKKR